MVTMIVKHNVELKGAWQFRTGTQRLQRRRIARTPEDLIKRFCLRSFTYRMDVEKKTNGTRLLSCTANSFPRAQFLSKNSEIHKVWQQCRLEYPLCREASRYSCNSGKVTREAAPCRFEGRFFPILSWLMVAHFSTNLTFAREILEREAI